MALSYDERQAIAVLRKALVRSGRHEAIIQALLQGMAQNIARTTLENIASELKQMLAVSRAFQDAARALSSKIERPNESGEPDGHQQLES